MARRISCNPDHYEDGVAFRFKFPDDGLALHAVDLIDGVPKLRFIASPKVPAICEEDVALCVRLSQEGRRPQFAYLRFPFNHPFYGRHYKWYQPTYLRGTSVGELLAEADWLMKCLNVGVRSDASKTRFWSWNRTSQLEGLATKSDFFEDQLVGSVFMSCKSVEVQKGNKEMIFGDPKMRINATNNSTYSKYITENFDSVAYHDAPLFLKMKELIKLILAIEWLKEEGVTFSRQWVMEHANKSQKSPLHVTEANSTKMSEEVVQNLPLVQLARVGMKEIAVAPNSAPFSVQITEKKISEVSLQLKIVARTTDQERQVENTMTLLASNDYDMLCKGIDPNWPVGFDADTGERIIPGVESWSELFSETVPYPCTWKFTPDGEEGPPVTGGVTTREIPVQVVPTPVPAASKAKAPARVPVMETTKPAVKREIPDPMDCQDHEEIAISASTARQQKKVKRSAMPQPGIVKRPPSDVGVKTVESDENRSLCRNGIGTKYGYTDRASCSKSSGDGRPMEQQRSVRMRCTHEVKVDGQDIYTTDSFGEILLPPMQVENGTSQPHQETPSMFSADQPAAAKGSLIPSEQSGHVELPSLSPAEQLVDAKESLTPSEDSGYPVSPSFSSMGNTNGNPTPSENSGHFELPSFSPMEVTNGSPTPSEDSGHSESPSLSPTEDGNESITFSEDSEYKE